ncbi:thiamine pyrophosphokinase [Gammaproteobacteria bacterium]
MKAIIVAGGAPPSKKLLNNEITSKSIIIAADNGADCLWKYQITPDYLIGDFDSIDDRVLHFWVNKNIPIERHPQNKNATDGQLALKKAIALDIKKIVFLGCLGGKRTDHLLGAFGLLAECLNLNIIACLKDDYQAITLLDQSIIIPGKNGEIFSLQAYGEPVKNLSISGSKYELKNYELEIGNALTLSNEFQDQAVSLQFTSGRLMLIRIFQ